MLLVAALVTTAGCNGAAESRNGDAYGARGDAYTSGDGLAQVDPASGVMVAPAATYASSGIDEPSPAPACTSTSCPWDTSS